MIPRKCCWCGKRFLAFFPYKAKKGLGKPVCSRKCRREIEREGGTFDGCLLLIGMISIGSTLIVGMLVVFFIQ